MLSAVSTFRYLLPAISLGLLAEPLSASDISTSDLDFFEKKVRPILIERCYECHSVESGKSKANLTVDSKSGLLQGGDNGPALVAGAPDKSLIIEAIRYKNRDMQMPPKSAMPAAEIKILEEWVQRGAPDPRTQTIAHGPQKVNIEKGREHWAFRPIANALPPQATHSHPIDAFTTTALTQKGLSLSRPADPVTLLRRMSFDLIGLPPTPEETTTFVSSYGKDPQKAIRTLIDRLLGSPHYGEKWGRHWLDVARYADSNGLDENVALGTAWRYRDYVVKSFNTDKPFDRFLIEQIAGDLLPAKSLEERHEHATATAFLNLGAKVLAEADKEKLVMDVVDEQIETTGRAFLAMTLGCVRCHDHKFDPISHEDYYALAAIFKSTRSFADEKNGAISFWFETPIGDLEDFAAVKTAELALAAKKQELATARSEEKKNPGPESKKRVEQLMDEMDQVEKNLPDLPTVVGVTDSAITPTVPIHIRGSHLTLGKPVERGFPKVMEASLAPKPHFPADKSGRLELAQWLARPEHPLTARVIVNRVWTWHFDQGLVRTPDNFGLLGESPTHPELLDYLATWLPANGWSLKDLHRLILTSATYQQASGPSVEKDPENRLLHHFPIRRLQAEEVRDALLSVSGQLDLNIGGKTVPLRNRQFVFNHTSKDATKYDSTRRALYLPIIRNNLYDLFQQFDYPDPAVSTGQRNSTVVSPQALLLMNSPLADQASRGLAKRVLQSHRDPQERIAQAIRLAYTRDAEAEDIANAHDFLIAADGILASSIQDYEERQTRAWELLCQSLMMANEFIYLR